jgi:hypothetical protein
MAEPRVPHGVLPFFAVDRKWTGPRQPGIWKIESNCRAASAIHNKGDMEQANEN